MSEERPTRICNKHLEKPAVIYGECIGCELESLHAEINRLRSNPPSGHMCVKCCGTIYSRDAMITDGDSGEHYHAICYVTQRAERAEADVKRLKSWENAMSGKKENKQWPSLTWYLGWIIAAGILGHVIGRTLESIL